MEHRYACAFRHRFGWPKDLATEEKLGRVSFAEPGLIIVSRITVDNMKKAVAEQYKRGYFNRLRSFVLGQN